MLSELDGKILFISSIVLPPKNPIEVVAGNVQEETLCNDVSAFFH